MPDIESKAGWVVPRRVAIYFGISDGLAREFVEGNPQIDDAILVEIRGAVARVLENEDASDPS